MSARTLRLLAVAVVVLFAAVWLVDRQRGGGTREDGLLLPGLEARLDEITAVRITDADGEVRIVREDDDWIVPAKGGYPADVAKLRELLLGLAEARRIEQKTANPELYDRLGVQDPEQEGASGKRVASEGLGEADFEVILGDSAQRDYRYARIAGDATSWLIDRNPKLPDDAAGWLVPEITDIPASRVQSVTIRHEGGDTIAIRKADAGDTNFTVDNIPEGRELSYPSVANSIASALDNLNLDDVRRAGEGAADSEGDVEPSRVTTVFRTFDGLEVTVESTGTEDETWIRLAAAAVPAGDAGTSGDAPGPDDGEETSDGGDGAGAGEAADEAPGNDAGEEETGDAEAAGDDAEAAESPDPAAEAESINARVSGWEYRIPRYKASQLRRGWDDLLAAVDDDEEE